MLLVVIKLLMETKLEVVFNNLYITVLNFRLEDLPSLNSLNLPN